MKLKNQISSLISILQNFNLPIRQRSGMLFRISEEISINLGEKN